MDFSNVITVLAVGDHMDLQAKSDATRWHRYTVTVVPVLQGGTTWHIWRDDGLRQPAGDGAGQRC